MTSAQGTEAVDRHAPALTGLRLRDLDRPQRWIAVALAVLVAAPFVIAAFQAMADDWYPTADNGTMLTVARQVFSANTPLTGEVASGTRYGAHPFHPGPFVYYILAPFVEVFGAATGMLLGAAFVNVSSIVLIGYVALRTAGRGAAIWAWITTLAMGWSLGGTAFLYPPFKTTLALLVITLFLFLCAALVSGRSTMLPLWALVISFPIAATMRYALPVMAIGAITVLVVAAQRWRRLGVKSDDDRDGDSDSDESADVDSVVRRVRRVLTLDRSEKRSVILAIVVFAVAWWAPVYEALTANGGNVREIYRASRTAAGQVDGVRLGAGELAKAILLDPVLTAADFGSTHSAAVVVIALAGLAVAALVARYRHDLGRARWSFVVVTAAALLLMLISLSSSPADEGYGNYRTLAASPVGGFVLFTTGLVIAVAVGPRLRTGPAVRAVGIGALVLATAAVAVPGPIDGATEPLPWGFFATETLVEQAEPHLTDIGGRWEFWTLGGRTTPAIFTGFKAGMGAAGIDTGIDARAPGMESRLGDPIPPLAGTVLFSPTVISPPGDEWELIAQYDPPGRSETDATRTAEALHDFAVQTNPQPLEAFSGALPRILCPDLAISGFQGPCPEAEQVLASENPVAELSPGVVALVYLVQYGQDSQFPVIDGEKPPQALLDDAAESWDNLPLSVYARPAND